MRPTAVRRACNKENLRRQILDAARQLFVESDFRSVSMRKIADKIEYSPTAIYLHFKDKNEILLELMKEGNILLAQRLESCLPSSEGLRSSFEAFLRGLCGMLGTSDKDAKCLDRVDLEKVTAQLPIPDRSELSETFRRGCLAYLQFAVDEPHYYKVMFLVEDEQMVSFCQSHLEEISGRTFGFLLFLAAAMKAAGIYRGGESPVMLSHVVWAWLHGAAMLGLSQRLSWLSPEDQNRYPELVAQQVAAFVTGEPQP